MCLKKLLLMGLMMNQVHAQKLTCVDPDQYSLQINKEKKQAVVLFTNQEEKVLKFKGVQVENGEKEVTKEKFSLLDEKDQPAVLIIKHRKFHGRAGDVDNYSADFKYLDKNLNFYFCEVNNE